MKGLDELKKIFSGKDKDELIKASQYTVEEYINSNPSLLDFSSQLFSKGMVSNNELIVDIGYPGTAYIHSPGSDVPRAQVYVNRITAPMVKISYQAALDVDADPNNIISKLLMDASTIREQLTLQKLKYVWNLVLAAAEASQIPAYMSASSVTKNNMDALINTLMDAAGTVKAIIGRKSLISQIYGWSGWSDATLESIEKGEFTQYRGAKLIGFEQCKIKKVDSATKAVIEEDILPPNMLILIGDQCGFEASTPIKTFSNFDYNTLTQVLTVTFSYGCAIVDNRKIGVYKIS